MLLPRVLELLIAQLPEAQRDPAPRGMGIDHFVDIAALRRDEGVA